MTDVAVVAQRRRTRPDWLRGPSLLGVTAIVGWTVVALTIPLWTPYDPLAEVASRLQPPSWSHLAGTDALGRDVFTRMLWGARTSLPVALVVIVSSVIIGTLIGAVAGYFGGWIDAVLMRLVDITMAFPPILLAMAITASLGPGVRNALIAMVIVWWPIYARLLRAQVIAVKQREYVESAEAIGVPRFTILRRYVLPMAYTPVLVNATMDFGQVVLLTASLSFIGLVARRRPNGVR